MNKMVSLAIVAASFLGLSHSADAQKAVKLFNGKDLSNWNFVVDKNAVPADQVFSVENGVIHIKGNPFGYMYTKEKYSDYKLHVEWRWPEGVESNSGIFLLIAARQDAFPGLMVSVVLAMLCHMPTQSLTSTIAMQHAPAEQFPRIRMFGSVGWVASGIFSIVALYCLHLPAFDDTNLPMYCGAAVCFVAALMNLRLPHTPPATSKATSLSWMDITGFSAFSLMKDKNYRIFMILTFLSIIPFTLYHVYGSMILADEHVQHITVTLNLGQLAEMFFLVITTSILVKSGIKKTLIYGLVALFVRYFAFFLGAETDAQWFYYIGIIVHGLIFGLFYVGGQVYTDQVAPKEMKARAQGLLFFLVWGIGFLIGTLWNGWLIDLFRDGDKCDWPVLFLISSGGSLILLLLFVFAFKPVELKREEE